MDKEKQIRAIELLNKMQEGPYVRTEQDNMLISDCNLFMNDPNQDNKELISIMKKSLEERKKYVEDYYNSLQQIMIDKKTDLSNYADLYAEPMSNQNSLEKPKVYTHKKKENGDVNIIFMLIISSLTIIGMILAVYYYNW